MTDRTPEQINHNIDQLLAIAAENTRGITELRQTVADMAGSINQLALATDRRLQQHDLELDDQDVRVERLERNHIEHTDRMAKLDETLVEIKDVQKDIRQILQIMTARFAGEPPLEGL